MTLCPPLVPARIPARRHLSRALWYQTVRARTPSANRPGEPHVLIVVVARRRPASRSTTLVNSRRHVEGFGQMNTTPAEVRRRCYRLAWRSLAIVLITRFVRRTRLRVSARVRRGARESLAEREVCCGVREQLARATTTHTRTSAADERVAERLSTRLRRTDTHVPNRDRFTYVRTRPSDSRVRRVGRRRRRVSRAREVISRTCRHRRHP